MRIFRGVLISGKKYGTTAIGSGIRIINDLLSRWNNVRVKFRSWIMFHGGVPRAFIETSHRLVMEQKMDSRYWI
ncbi:hypothetical protein LAZ67_13000982 [Cordylochernes scorpioides]|uniref:Uncharacterized protein n=1 Tax=Cordylochernes scorpioides TaxID=51811 RepID=A0ABY6L4A3_9ARAC|nr:hypothetical protein LAZ67_13000982 [Cordylochernes scorpioides]